MLFVYFLGNIRVYLSLFFKALIKKNDTDSVSLSYQTRVLGGSYMLYDTAAAP